MTITRAGTVIRGKDITDTVTIRANNVVITNSRIHGSGDFGIRVASGSLTISNSTVSGFDNGIIGDHYTASHVEVTGVRDDGFKLGSHVTIASSWCHRLTPEAGAHADCAQMETGEVSVVIRDSWLDPNGGGSTNSALFLAPDLGPSTNGPLTITNNVLGGGNFAIYCVDGNNGQYLVKNITIHGNRFLRDSRYGSVRVNVRVSWTNNTWADTGRVVHD